MNLIYDKKTGNIIRAISDDQDYRTYYKNWGDEFIDNLGSIKVDVVPLPLWEYYVKDGKVLKYTKQEIEEKELYGKILTEEERLLNKIKPTPEEIKKAENTIEVLTLIQEVM